MTLDRAGVQTYVETQGSVCTARSIKSDYGGGRRRACLEWWRLRPALVKASVCSVLFCFINEVGNLIKWFPSCGLVVWVIHCSELLLRPGGCPGL